VAAFVVPSEISIRLPLGLLMVLNPVPEVPDVPDVPLVPDVPAAPAKLFIRVNAKVAPDESPLESTKYQSVLVPI